MVASNMGPASAKLQQKKPVPTYCGPMMQQGTACGYEMHPQEFVRLIGCHEVGRQKEDVAERLDA